MTADLIADETAQKRWRQSMSRPSLRGCPAPGRDVTGRVFEVSGRRFCLVDPWRRGPRLSSLMEVSGVGPIVDAFLDHAAPHERMGGNS